MLHLTALIGSVWWFQVMQEADQHRTMTFRLLQTQIPLLRDLLPSRNDLPLSWRYASYLVYSWLLISVSCPVCLYFSRVLGLFHWSLLWCWCVRYKHYTAIMYCFWCLIYHLLYLLCVLYSHMLQTFWSILFNLLWHIFGKELREDMLLVLLLLLVDDLVCGI